jgi:hypothetical protein
LEDEAIELLNALVDSAGIRPSVNRIARRLNTTGPTLVRRRRFMALWHAAEMRAKPQRPGRPPNATEDQALDYLADAIRSAGHRPSQKAIERALGIGQATLNGWQRFKAAHRAAPSPPPTWPRNFGRLKPPAAPQTPPPADAGTEAQIPAKEPPAVFSRHDDRDKWIYEQAMNGREWDRIRSHLDKHEEWEPIGTVNGVKDAARRYARRHGKPVPPRRKHGCPAGK